MFFVFLSRVLLFVLIQYVAMAGLELTEIFLLLLLSTGIASVRHHIQLVITGHSHAGKQHTRSWFVHAISQNPQEPGALDSKWRNLRVQRS